MMKYFFTAIFLLITSELLFTAADERRLGKKTGLASSLLRSGGQHPFDKLTSTGGATRITDAPGDVAQWRKPGGLDQAFDDFVSLPGKPGKDVSKDNKIIFTKDMGALGKVTMREHSTEGSPTLELQRPNGDMLRQAYFLILLVTFAIHEVSQAASGWCYQCDSRNPRCGNKVDPSLSSHKVPCNGQCYTYSYKNVVYRGCSWEHGFMTRQSVSEPVYDKENVWLFCDTPLCNNDADRLKAEICDSVICPYLTFPAACKLNNIDTQCGRACGNPLCFSK
ncbi:unnamed protein product [Adineta ricciae]|uniref:Uncharacterized protein n=1 Tax=Adineta ricciae TaxID=249248 RepID=A0A815HIN3_ADIRI|nr:unnamed protein product [Adineta ricciae]CAF1471694.1 unnamed protein product [Adineta ricciae]